MSVTLLLLHCKRLRLGLRDSAFGSLMLPSLTLLLYLLRNIAESASVDIREEIITAILPKNLSEVLIVIVACFILLFAGLTA